MTFREAVHTDSTDATRTCAKQSYGIGSARFRARTEALAWRRGTAR